MTIELFIYSLGVVMFYLCSMASTVAMALILSTSSFHSKRTYNGAVIASCVAVIVVLALAINGAGFLDGISVTKVGTFQAELVGDG